MPNPRSPKYLRPQTPHPILTRDDAELRIRASVGTSKAEVKGRSGGYLPLLDIFVVILLAALVIVFVVEVLEVVVVNDIIVIVVVELEETLPLAGGHGGSPVSERVTYSAGLP